VEAQKCRKLKTHKVSEMTDKLQCEDQ